MPNVTTQVCRRGIFYGYAHTFGNVRENDRFWIIFITKAILLSSSPLVQCKKRQSREPKLFGFNRIFYEKVVYLETGSYSSPPPGPLDVEEVYIFVCVNYILVDQEPW